MPSKQTKKDSLKPFEILCLSKFLCCFMAFHEWNREEGSDSAEKVRLAGANLSRNKRLVSKAKLFSDKMFEAKGVVPGLTGIDAKYKAADRGAGETRMLFVGDLARFVISRIKTTEQRNSILGKSPQMNRMSVLFKPGDPKSAVLGVLKTKGSWPNFYSDLKKWINSVADVMGISGSAEEQIADINGVTSIAEDVREIDRKLLVLSPNSTEARELSRKRTQKVASIIDAARETGHEEAALGAASALIYSNDSHATKVGKQLGLTQEQEKAMMGEGRNMIVAGAGSGKTRVLAGKVVDLIDRLGASSNEIIATSFSVKSAAELKERVKKYGGESILDAGDDGFGTSHSVSRKLLAKLNPKQAYKQTVNESLLLKMAMAQVEMRARFAPEPPAPVGMFEGLFATEDKEIGAPASLTQEDMILQQVVRSMWGLIEFGRDRNPNAKWVRDDGALLLPLFEKGQELTVDSLSPAEKGMLNKMLRTKSRQDEQNNRPGRYERSLQRKGLPADYKVASTRGSSKYWKTPANQWFNIGGRFKKDDDRGNSVVIGSKQVGLAVGKYRANLITESQAWAQAKDPTEKLMAACYGAYMWLKENDRDSNGKVDFTDMLLDTVKELIENPQALRQVQGQYKYVLVDEGQDFNKLQRLLFGLIAGHIDPETLEQTQEMTANTLCYIGDDKQAIYGFRGADPAGFIADSDQTGGDFETHVITSNFRSGTEIVEAANRLMRHSEDQIPMVCSANPARGSGSINYVTVKDHMAGAERCAQEIEEYIESEGWTEPDTPSYGVAVRTNAEAYAYGIELIKRKIPFRSKMNFFADPTTKALTGWLTIAENPDQVSLVNEAVLKAFRSPSFMLNQKFAQELKRLGKGNFVDWLSDGGWNKIYAEEWRNRNVKAYSDTLTKVRKMKGSPTEILDQILEITGVAPRGKVPQSIVDSLIQATRGDKSLMNQLSEESADGSVSDTDVRNLALAPIAPLRNLLAVSETDISTSMDYVRELQGVSESKGYKDNPTDADADKPAVTIDTCHGWKGLEARRMWIPMAAGTFPHHKSENSREDLEAERRLAYVALTRGRDSVTCLCPEKGHTGKPAGVSRFVREACIPDLYSSEEDTRQASGREALIAEYLRSDNMGDDFTEEDWSAYVLATSYGEIAYRREENV